MKSILSIIILCTFLNNASAQSNEPRSIIYSIDDYNYPRTHVEVSEEALPSDHYQELIRNAYDLGFTPISEARASSLFVRLKSDSRARMSYPGSLCSSRRIHIQNVLRGLNIRSGKLHIRCPGNNGRLRLRDQVSGRYFTYSNFHETNVVLVQTASGHSYRVMDLQFQSSPVSLGHYLAQIEAFQRLRPGKTNDRDAGICYWRVSSPNFTFAE